MCTVRRSIDRVAKQIKQTNDRKEVEAIDQMCVQRISVDIMINEQKPPVVLSILDSLRYI